MQDNEILAARRVKLSPTKPTPAQYLANLGRDAFFAIILGGSIVVSIIGWLS